MEHTPERLERALELGGVVVMEETALELVWLAAALGRGSEIGSSVAASVPHRRTKPQTQSSCPISRSSNGLCEERRCG
jgi:hypothetical protein